jgi:hypothetical protein
LQPVGNNGSGPVVEDVVGVGFGGGELRDRGLSPPMQVPDHVDYGGSPSDGEGSIVVYGVNSTIRAAYIEFLPVVLEKRERIK